MSKVRVSPVVESRRRRPFFSNEHKITPTELADHGAPRRGIVSFLLTGMPPNEGVGKYSTGNAAERAHRTRAREKGA